MKFLTIILLLVSAAAIESARIRNCGSDAKIDFKNLEITGCSPNSRACIFKKNQTAKLKIPMTTKNEITSLKAVVHGIIAGLPIPFPLDQPEACGNVLKCPIAANTPFTYNEGLPVKSIYPSLGLTVKWEMFDQNNKRQVCLLIPVRISN